MAVKLRDALLDLVADLRTAQVRISVAESMDAMQAVAAAGLERVRMREALRATLIKDERDNPVFDEVFARRFGGAHQAEAAGRQSRGANIGVSGSGVGGGAGASKPSRRDQPTQAEPSRAASSDRREKSNPGEPLQSPSRSRSDRRARAGDNHVPEYESQGQSDSMSSGIAAEQAGETMAANSPGDRSPADRSLEAAGAAAGRLADARRIERTPFSNYSDLEYETARDILAALKRRIRARLGRRLRIASSGRVDFRRTIRAAIQRGGSMVDLRFRARRPRHFDLLVLADISGSVKYASGLMLELVAGVRECFRNVTSLVYIDRLAEAELQQGHLVMTPLLDLYARSDFGLVLRELLADHSTLLTRATVVLILGDARNNRRPARADLLRGVTMRSRTVIWLNPEPSERWNTGDSAIAQYGREVDALLPCASLRELETALGGLSLG